MNRKLRAIISSFQALQILCWISIVLRFFSHTWKIWIEQFTNASRVESCPSLKNISFRGQLSHWQEEDLHMQVLLTLIGVTSINLPVVIGEKTLQSTRIQVLMITICQMVLRVIITRKSRCGNLYGKGISLQPHS